MAATEPSQEPTIPQIRPNGMDTETAEAFAALAEKRLRLAKDRLFQAALRYGAQVFGVQHTGRELSLDGLVAASDELEAAAVAFAARAAPLTNEATDG